MPPSGLPDRIAAVTLDAGGVLALPAVSDALAARGISLDLPRVLAAHHAAVAVEDALLADRPDVVDGLGAERRSYYLAFAAHLGLDGPDAEALVADLDDLARREVPWRLVAPGAADLVPALNQLGVPVAVVSNSNGTVARQLAEMAICQAGPGPCGEVVVVVDSGAVGVRKPDPAIFDHALDVLGTPREETVHVGDTVAFDVVAARAAGLVGIHYDATGRCRGDHPHIAALEELVELVRSRRTGAATG